MTETRQKKANDFLEICGDFRLGQLPTEQPNPKTAGLDGLAKNNLSEAISVLKSVDIQCLSVLEEKFKSLEPLHLAIVETLASCGRIFICGCGATGRLALALERIFREDFPNGDRAISFMAGGDVALINSIEEFEDYPDYGARQLIDLGFSDNDLLIGSSEGGETPWVIGAVEKSSEISKRPPFFLYYNPDKVLIEQVQRSREIIQNPKIKK